MTDASGKAATPPEELRRQIMDPRVPKNEREWWASREIEAQAARIAELTEALRPFANAARYLRRETEEEVCENIGAKHLIAAADALQRNEHR